MLPSANTIEWAGNGIEHVYPETLLSAIYRSSEISPSALIIEKDVVRYNDLPYKKMELCKLVIEKLTTETLLPEELTNKRLLPLAEFMQ